MSSLTYLIDIYTANIPVDIIKEIKDLIREFLWGGKTWRIAQKTVSLKKEHGGLEIPDIDCFIMAKKVKWILRINFSDENNWNTLGKKYLKTLDTSFGQDLFLLRCTSLSNLNIQHLPSFYQCCIKSWSEIAAKNETLSKSDVLSQDLFGNSNIYDKKGSLLFKKWSRSKICKICDVWDTNGKKWKSGIDIFNKLIDKRNWMVEYERIKNAIPKSWIQKLKYGTNINEESKLLINNEMLTIHHDKITRKGKEICLKKVKFKELYFNCLYPANQPKCIIKWQNILGHNVDWKRVCTNLKHSIQGRKQKEFHYKCLHRSIYSEMRLKLMNKSNGVCKLCVSFDETTCHMLYICPSIQQIWLLLEAKIFELTNIRINITVEIVIFGYYENEEKNRDIQNVINCAIYETKWQIWKHRNDVKYGKKDKVPVNQLMNKIIRQIKTQLELYKNKMISRNDAKLLLLLNTCIDKC